MKHIHIREKRIEPEPFVGSITCDICGKEGKERYSDRGDWSGGEENDIEETAYLYYRTGKQYSGDGYGDKWEYQICPECFKSKIMPILKEAGAKMEPEFWDY